jgi:aminomethyltransferase
MLRHTALNSAHRALGAKLVDFAGWEMPVAYGSQLEEHARVRADAGMFDVSHMLAVDVIGAHARDFLRRVLANDVAKLAQPGAALYSCLLNERAGVLDDLIVYRLDARDYRLVVNAGTAEKDLAWLALRQREDAFDVALNPRRDLAILAVQGPNARAKTWAALPQARAASEALKSFHACALDDYFIARTGYTGEDGFEIILPAARAGALWQALLDQGVVPCGLGARDTLRLEAGMNLYGQDMDETITPAECGLAWTLALDGERDFLGKAALLAAQPKHARVGLVLIDKGVLRAHQSIVQGGEITSGGFSPTMNRSIALARVPFAAKLRAGAQVEVMVRDKRLSARVVEPPFVRNGKILIKESL